MTKSESVHILAVDDSPDTLEGVRRNLVSAGYSVHTVPGVDEAIRVLDSMPIDLVITDLRMPKVSGMDLIRHVRENHADLEVIMITGYASVPNAVEAMQTGAQEYLAKPFTDDELLGAVNRSIQRLRLRRAASGAGTAAPAVRGLLGESEPMKRVGREIEKAAQSSATVLILGESGTGKELVARGVHYSSVRASAPFIPVNCGGIPDGLLESELFGVRKGAYTGAHESRSGFFQAAEGGSIFLDEIAELTMAMQTVLLRVLQDKVVYRVGEHQPHKVDVRILAATNKNLETLIEKGEFREDLYYRINVIPLSLPPLRERTDDIPLLVRHFASRFAKEQDKPAPVFDDRVLNMFQTYAWPGNVRELENVVQRLVVMTERDVITAPELPELMRFSALQGGGVQRSLAQVEAEHIHAVLASVEDNKTQAAKILGIDRKTLQSKLKA